MAVDKKLFERAKKSIPGGVNSPVRSFYAVGGEPIFMQRGKGSKLFDENGKSYIDYCLSWGAAILGHAHPASIPKGTSLGTVTRLEIEFAELIKAAFPSIDLLRLTNSGTEATMSAVRLAIAYTGRKKIIKFKGCYHGAGIPDEIAEETISIPYNDLETLDNKANRSVAAIIVEPVAGNMGVVLPEPGFLEGIREVCDRHSILMIMDEVITGFRFCFGGAQNIFKIKPDLTTLGKIIGGGLPAGAFGGKKEIMSRVAPRGDFMQAGTFSGNSATVSAGLAALKYLKRSNPYPALEQKTKFLCANLKAKAEKSGLKLSINYFGSMFSLFFSEDEVTDYKSAKTQKREQFSKFYHKMLREGIYFSPSGMEANFISAAHSDGDLTKTIKAAEATFKSMRGE